MKFIMDDSIHAFPRIAAVLWDSRAMRRSAICWDLQTPLRQWRCDLHFVRDRFANPKNGCSVLAAQRHSVRRPAPNGVVHLLGDLR
ncbi:hypothetical protein [Mesorhizobium sp. M0011]|uniref:hypothetical protein n=1 Tax=Mesorhizobium sp. M0011 TaxID=2956839 RepID=UPI003335BC6F